MQKALSGCIHGLSARNSKMCIRDRDNAPRCFSCVLDDVNVKPDALIKKYCGDGKCFVSRSNPAVEHIFSELYSVPEKIRRGYFKIKILELLLFLSGTEIKDEKNCRPAYSQSQVELAKRVCLHLTEHMDDKITLSQLSEAFHVSGTQIKDVYKRQGSGTLAFSMSASEMEPEAKYLVDVYCVNGDKTRLLSMKAVSYTHLSKNGFESQGQSCVPVHSVHCRSGLYVIPNGPAKLSS